MKKYLKKLMHPLIYFLYSIPGLILFLPKLIYKGLVKVELDVQNNYLSALTAEVVHYTKSKNKIELKLYTPNFTCLHRAETFSIKEPETLEWIEEFGATGGVFYDVGSNIGLYSIYHSVVNKGKVVSFEPSFFNLKLLAKNININSVQDMITVITSPLTSHNSINTFNYHGDSEGGSMHAFGVDYGYDGEKFDSVLSIKVAGSTLDFLIENKLIEDFPDFIKIDVDGIEHLLLSGAINTLKNKKCKSVLIEVNEEFLEQAIEIKKILKDCGFILRNKTDHVSTFNQIWVRP
jgi:FkbM family methyltransferase